MKILITGTPGSGKTAVAEALRQAGYEAFDGEAVSGLVRLEIKATGEPADWPGGHIDWDYYAWNIQEIVLTDFLASQETVYVALTASNIDSFLYLFDKVIVLTVEDAVLEKRLRARTTHEFGQDNADINRWVKNNQKITRSNLEKGGTAIDNSQSLEVTISGILEVCESIG